MQRYKLNISPISFSMLGFAFACSDATIDADTAMDETGDLVETFRAEPQVKSPRWNNVFGKATHNSYWFNRNQILDPFASGTEEQLIDQLLFEKVGALEFDIRLNTEEDGDFVVAHTDQPSFSSCNPLSDCLEILRSFHYAVPNHHPILVIIELKGTPLLLGARTFDANHTIEDLDDNLRSVLGDTLYGPADFMAECGGATTMMECLVLRGGWPSLDELRGKFVVGVKGEWDNNYNDWIAYGSQDDVRLRAAFPTRQVHDHLGSGWVDWGAGIGAHHDDIDVVAEQRARDNSVIWSMNSWTPEEESPGEYFMEATFNGTPLKDLLLVRGGYDNAESENELAQVLTIQRDAIRMGFTWFVSDFPWNTFIEHGPGTDVDVVWPFDFEHRYYDPDDYVTLFPSLAPPPDVAAPALLEPGNRIVMRTASVDWPFAYNAVPANSYRWWETTVSLTRHKDTYGVQVPRTARDLGWGCLRAAASWDNWVQICRTKDGNSGTARLS
jgi:hypothetical protein